jgi:hypothetical protein
VLAGQQAANLQLALWGTKGADMLQHDRDAAVVRVIISFKSAEAGRLT